MKTLIMMILTLSLFPCQRSISNTQCDEKFFLCAHTCSNICHKTIDRAHEFGKCFAICSQPCREEYCKEACMVETVDTEDLKSFAKIRRGGSSPSVSINKNATIAQLDRATVL